MYCFSLCLQFNLKFKIDCSNVESKEYVLQLLQLREQVIRNFGVLNEMTFQPTLEANFIEEYITWHNIVKPIIDTNGTVGLFGTFPNYLNM